jgi:hypothetical protein
MSPARETSIFEDLIEPTFESLGEIAQGVMSEVAFIAGSFATANPESGLSQADLEQAAYFAKSVEDTEKYPPLNSAMQEAVEERQAYERAETAMGEKSVGNQEPPEQDQQAQLYERMQAHLERQKEMEM